MTSIILSSLEGYIYTSHYLIPYNHPTLKPLDATDGLLMRCGIDVNCCWHEARKEEVERH